MRLAQLARKLSVKPDVIVDFLATHSIQIEDTANAKIEDEHTRLAVSHFAPQLLEEQIEELAQQPEEIQRDEVVHVEVEPVIDIHDSLLASHIVSDQNLNDAVTTSEELPDIIRAPKVELTGLKVLGKIELPEKKKKEEPVAQDGAEPATQAKEASLEHRKNKRQPGQRNGRNPISEARERELREIEEKRKQEEEIRREQRRQSYLRTREAKAPAKKQKQASAKLPHPTAIEDSKPEPTTWLGRFMRWLTSNQ